VKKLELVPAAYPRGNNTQTLLLKKKRKIRRDPVEVVGAGVTIGWNNWGKGSRLPKREKKGGRGKKNWGGGPVIIDARKCRPKRSKKSKETGRRNPQGVKSRKGAKYAMGGGSY